jgi:purine nucleosidase
LHTLADQEKIDFTGVIVTSDDPYAPVCVSAINTYFKRPRLPVGFLKNQLKLTNHSRYTRQIATEFPHRLKSHEEAKDGTEVYRKLLSKSPDESVVLVTIGHLSSLQNPFAIKA